MMRLFLNGLAASAGGGLTYLRNLVPHLTSRPEVHTTLAVGPKLQPEFERLPNLSLLPWNSSGNAARRFCQEQFLLPGLIRGSGANVLISAGNFALRNSPVSQILLARNSLYTSADFFRDLRARGDYRLWFDTLIKSALARRSLDWADRTVAPTTAFAEELQRWHGVNILTIHHGFDHDAFFRDSTPLPAEIQQKLQAAQGCLRLLFVSHYNYYRNFETLLRALPALKQHLQGRVRLILTCKLRAEDNPGNYRTDAASALVARLGVDREIVELGIIPHHLLHQIYRACDIYVTPAYAESFAHPLVEAMATGVPVVASDLTVHREVCQDAALYFPRFSSDELAGRVLQLVNSPQLAARLAESGRRRSQDFSWDKHVDELLAVAEELIGADRS